MCLMLWTLGSDVSYSVDYLGSDVSYCEDSR